MTDQPLEPRLEDSEPEQVVEEPAAEESAPAPDESYLRLAADFDNSASASRASRSS